MSAEEVSADKTAAETAASPEPVRKSGNDEAAKFLQEIKQKPVVIKLASGIEYHGILDAVDGFLNITLKETKEVFQNKTIAEYGDVFLRGTLVTYISAA